MGGLTRMARGAAVIAFAGALLAGAGGAAQAAVARPLQLNGSVLAANASRLLAAPGVAASGTCAQVRRQAAELVRAGHTRASCIQPVSSASARPAAARSRGAGLAGLPSTCGFGSWYANRFELCNVQSFVYTIYQLNAETGTTVIGQLSFDFGQDIEFSGVASSFSENDEFQGTGAWGAATSGTVLSFAASCGSSCTASSFFANFSPVNAYSVVTGTVGYVDSTQTVDSTASSYALALSNPIVTGGSPAAVPWSSPTYRCDDEAALYPGCVVPSVAPILTTMPLLPAIAANIRSIQAAGPHHYGSLSYVPAYPLHRTTNSAIQTANGNTACPPSKKPRPGGTTPRAYYPPPPGSCDEYPFASTYEGASLTQKPDWGTATVPVAQQSAQGGYISSFYQSQRVLDGDAFWVVV
jgi:hypothetical protein